MVLANAAFSHAPPCHIGHRSSELCARALHQRRMVVAGGARIDSCHRSGDRTAPGRGTGRGHSAGAQLCALLLDDSQPERIGGALLLSGLYDLRPLQDSFLRDEIALADEEVARFSPLTQGYALQAQIELFVGANETAPFHAQADAFAAHLTQSGVAAARRTIAGTNHMSIVADLGMPGSDVSRLLARVIETVAGRSRQPRGCARSAE